MGSLFCFNAMHIVTKGMFTWPARSFFVFAHNLPISPEMLQSHELVMNLKHVSTKEYLMDVGGHPMMPKLKEIDYKKISTKKDIDLVEFQQSFYTNKFKDPNARPSELE